MDTVYLLKELNYFSTRKTKQKNNLYNKKPSIVIFSITKNLIYYLFLKHETVLENKSGVVSLKFETVTEPYEDTFPMALSLG